MDFMAEELADGRRICPLTRVVHLTGENLAIEFGRRLCGRDAVTVPNVNGLCRRLPKIIRVDNGPEITSNVPGSRGSGNQVTLDFSRTGKPAESEFMEPVGDWRKGSTTAGLCLCRTQERRLQAEVLTTTLCGRRVFRAI